jgi:hypothetical protein
MRRYRSLLRLLRNAAGTGGNAGVAGVVGNSANTEAVMADVETGAVAWVNIAGLALDLVGAAWLAWGLFIDEDEALKLGLPEYAYDTREENLQRPRGQGSPQAIRPREARAAPPRRRDRPADRRELADRSLTDHPREDDTSKSHA